MQSGAQAVPQCLHSLQTFSQGRFRRESPDRERYRIHMGLHFPAMVLVEVKGFVDDNAKIEIEGIAVL